MTTLLSMVAFSRTSLHTRSLPLLSVFSQQTLEEDKLMTLKRGLAPPVHGHAVLAIVGPLPGQGDGGLGYQKYACERVQNVNYFFIMFSLLTMLLNECYCHSLYTSHQLEAPQWKQMFLDSSVRLVFRLMYG